MTLAVGIRDMEIPSEARALAPTLSYASYEDRLIKTISEERNSPNMSLLRLPKQPLAPHLRDSEFLGYSLAAGSEYITPSREGLDLKQCQEGIVIKNKKSQSPQVHQKTTKKVCRWSFLLKKNYLRESPAVPTASVERYTNCQ